MKFKINWDAFGIAASVACAIHCAVLPLILSSLPLFGVNIIENQGFEFIMIALAFVVGVYSLYHGRKKHHHSYYPMLLFAAGISLLFIKSMLHSHSLMLLLPAVTLVVIAHYLNYKLCRVHNHAHDDDCNH
jgi:uncharacterized membrane protein YoaK (UPF0700 family)